jgi:hypothetical protein
VDVLLTRLYESAVSESQAAKSNPIDRGGDHVSPPAGLYRGEVPAGVRPQDVRWRASDVST